MTECRCRRGGALQIRRIRHQHALALGIRVVVLLLKTFIFVPTRSVSSACTSPAICGASTSWPSNFQDMHDANYTGKKAGQSQVHAWFVFDQDCGPATINPVSLHRPTARMPSAPPVLLTGSDNGNGYHGTPGT